MSIDFSTVKTSLYTWATANVPSGMPVILLYNNAPRPVIDYVTIYVSTVSQIGWDYVRPPLTTAGISEQVGDREFTCQIQAYGGNPLNVLNNLRTSLQKQSVLDTLRANGIVFADWYPVNDITELVDTRFEQRASLDILFRIADIYDETSGVISTVSLEEVFKEPDGTTIYDKTFLIPPPP